jgi:hypothetical protein
MRIAFLGTSHTYDRFDDYLGYQPTHGHGLTWCEYIGKQLSAHVDNMGIVAMSMDTYFARLHSYLEHNPKPNMVVIEIPSTGRFTYAIENNNSKNFNFCQPTFWDTTKKTKSGYNTSFITLTGIEANLNYTHEDVLSMSKVKSVNSQAIIPIKPQQYIDFVKFHILIDRKYLLYDIFVKTLIICEYLKQNNITPICWTFDAIKNFNQNPIGNITEKMNLISNKSVEIIANDMGYTRGDKKYYPDGFHLIQEKWREIADSIFMPVIQGHLNDR